MREKRDIRIDEGFSHGADADNAPLGLVLLD
jgi:hypothetical protein